MRSRKVLPITALAVLATVASTGLVGCSGADTSVVADPTPTSNPEECNTAALDALYEKAQEEEGALLWYYTSPPELAGPVQEAFAEAFPGKTVDYVQITGLGIPARVIQELDAGATSADVGAGGVNEAIQLRDRDLTTEFDAEELGLVTPELLPAPDMVAISQTPSTLVYNTDLVPEDRVPTTWDEFADGDWTGGFGLWQFPYAFANLAVERGEDSTTELVETLASKAPVLYQSNFPLAADIGAGKIEIGIGKYHTTLPTIDSGAPVAQVLIDPVPLDTMAAYVVSESPRPNTAKLFLAWLVCGAGAQVLESSLGTGNMLVPGTELNAMLEGHVTSEWSVEDADELSRLLKEYGDILASGGTPAAP